MFKGQIHLVRLGVLQTAFLLLAYYLFFIRQHHLYQYRLFSKVLLYKRETPQQQDYSIIHSYSMHEIHLVLLKSFIQLLGSVTGGGS